MTTQADQGVSQPAVLPIPNQLKPSYPSPHSPGGALAPPRRISPHDGPLSAPPISPSLLPERPSVPTRASTLGSENELSHHRQLEDSQDHARSEDLSHSLAPNPHDAVFAAPSPAYLSPSRPTTPGSSNEHIPSSSGHSDRSEKRLSASSIYSGSSNSQAPNRPPPTATSVSSVTSTYVTRPSRVLPIRCAADPPSIGHVPPAGRRCREPSSAHWAPYIISSVSNAWCVSPEFFIPMAAICQVLTTVPLQDCGTVVASKFFPIDGPDGKQQPLCERDYFRRLNLICAKCGMALRGSYITACSALTLPPSSLLPDRLHAHHLRQEVPRRTLHLLHLPDALWPSGLVLRARRRCVLPLSLFDPVRDEVRRMQYGDFETVCRDQS